MNVLGQGLYGDLLYTGGSLKLNDVVVFSKDFLAHIDSNTLEVGEGESAYIALKEVVVSGEDTLAKDGYANGEELENHIQDDRTPHETARRKVVQYDLLTDMVKSYVCNVSNYKEIAGEDYMCPPYGELSFHTATYSAQIEDIFIKTYRKFLRESIYFEGNDADVNNYLTSINASSGLKGQAIFFTIDSRREVSFEFEFSGYSYIPAIHFAYISIGNSGISFLPDITLNFRDDTISTDIITSRFCKEVSYGIRKYLVEILPTATHSSDYSGDLHGRSFKDGHKLRILNFKQEQRENEFAHLKPIGIGIIIETCTFTPKDSSIKVSKILKADKNTLKSGYDTLMKIGTVKNGVFEEETEMKVADKKTLDKLKLSVGNTYEQVMELKNNISSVSSDVNVAKQKIDNLSTKLSDLSTKFDGLSTKFDDLAKKITL